MKVKFLPMDKEFEIGSNESVLEVAKKNGVFIKSICGGLPSCSECRVKVVSGEHNIMPPNFKEKSLIGSAYFVDHSRLSCQIRCMGDITVDLSEQVVKQTAQPASKKPRMPMKYAKKEPGTLGAPRERSGPPQRHQQFKPPGSIPNKKTDDQGGGDGGGGENS